MGELWTVGLNMPGFMPETEPSEYDSWDDARDALVSELEHTAEVESQALTAEADPTLGNEAEKAEAAIAALDAAIARVKALRPGQPYGETVGKYHYWLDQVTD